MPSRTPRKSKYAAAELAKAIFPTLGNVTICIDMPTERFQRREAYRAVNSVAFRVFGSGNYKMRSLRGFSDMVQVTHLRDAQVSA